MYSWMERLNGRGRREDNKLVFDRKLKIVEIFSADVVGSSLSLFFSRRLPFFFSLSPSVNLLILFPRDAVFISTNCSKRHREEYTSTQKYTSRPDVDCLTTTRNIHSHSASCRTVPIATNERIEDRLAISLRADIGLLTSVYNKLSL